MSVLVVRPVTPSPLHGRAIRPAEPALDGGVPAKAEVELLSQAKIDELRATLSVDMRRHLHRVFADVLPARLDALELALRAGDEVERKRVGHLLSGSSAMVGATRLSELCGKLERAAPDAFVVDAAIAGLIAVAAETRAALERQLA